MSESVASIPQNGFPLPNGTLLPDGMRLPNGVRLDLNPWREIRQRMRFRIGTRARRIVRILVVIILALIIFLLMAEPVIAST